MTGILFEIVRICCPWFKCNDLENQESFLIFFVPFEETTLNFEHLSKKGDRHTHFILEITDCRGLG